jgi:hypothetical protein
MAGPTDLAAPLSRMWRDVYAKAAAVAEAKTRELLKYHVYVYPHSAGGGAAGAGLPRCSARLKLVTLTVHPGTVFYPAGTPVPLDEDEFDPDDWHDTATPSPYIVVPDEGDYQIVARFEWDTVGTTDPQSGTARQLRIRVTTDGDFPTGARSLMAPQQMGSLPGMTQEVTHFAHLLAGDQVYMTVAHDADGDLINDSAYERCPRLTVVKLS